MKDFKDRNKIFTKSNIGLVSNGVLDFTINRFSLKLTCPLG